jgi:hypothetical protein
MHRFNLCAALLPAALASPEPRLQLSHLLVWLRLSATRQLTWQRNYNGAPLLFSLNYT